MKHTYFLSLIIIFGGYFSALGADFSWLDLSKGISWIPLEVTTETLQQAVKTSNPYQLKVLLSHKGHLKKETKEELLTEAKEIAQQSRRNCSIFKSPWDAGRFILGFLLFYKFMNGDILGHAEKLADQERQIQEYVDRSQQIIDDGQSQVTLLNPGRKDIAFRNHKEYNAYQKIFKTKTILTIGKYLDIMVKYFGFYWTVRGYFTVTANKQNKNAHHVVELLEQTPTE